MDIKVNHVNEPTWAEFTVKAKMPEKLERLEEIAHNLWWVWTVDAKALYRSMDPELWRKVRHNPIALLEQIKLERLNELVKDKVFMADLDNVYAQFRAYMDVEPIKDVPSIAYFSMEYGLSDHLKIYSGGLGVLAGDYLKEASDDNVNMVAIGFLYRYGYFTQELSVDGQQVAKYEAQHFNSLPITQVKDADGHPVVVEVPYPGRVIYAYVWKAQVGRVPLYLLDTDLDLNSEFDKVITYQL